MRRRAAALVERVLGLADASDLLLAGGLGCVATGVAQWSEPAAWCVVGVALIVAGMLKALSNRGA